MKTKKNIHLHKKRSGVFNRFTAFIFIVMAVFALLLSTLFGMLYDSAHDNIIQIQLNEVQATSSDIDFYLDTAVNALSFSKKNIEQLHKNGADSARLYESISIMTNTFESSMDDDLADIYGLMYGDFLNGHGWVPDEGYEPTERGWYTAARARPGRIVSVPPYIDAESGQACVTLSETLEGDTDSVIAFDISAAKLQSIVDEAASDEAVVSAKIIDKSKRVVIVSNNRDEMMQDHRDDKRVAAAITNHDTSYTNVKDNGRDYIVFIMPLSIGWDYVCIYDSSELLSSLRSLYFFSAAGVILFISIMLLVLNQMRNSQDRMNRLIDLSQTDALTGILNRGSGEAKIGEMLEKRMKCTFLMLDVDRFKSINDTYGHDTGDKVIIAVAEMLSECAKPKDVVMRLGGDEFVIVLGGVADRSYAEDIINKLFSLVDNATIPGAEELKLSISMGAAFYDGVGRADFAKLYQTADEKIYISKATEGNKVTF